VTPVDTVGAGDAFNAGLIDALVSGRDPRQAVTDAVQLASRKVAQEGFVGLGPVTPKPMPQALTAGQAQRLCALAELADPDSRGFDLWVDGRALPILLVRRGETVRAWRNECPHQGLRLESAPDRFLTADGSRILCARHAAEFELASGECSRGPCRGDALMPVPIRIESGAVWYDPVA